jgi:protein SCO1/2
MQTGQRVLLATAIALASGAAVVAIAKSPAPTPAPDVYGQLADFAFTDDAGRPFTPEALRGKVTVANFIFTRCTTVCPVETLKMKRFAEDTTGLADLRLVSFSVDPEHDTPDVLRAFRGKFTATDPRWHFVTGDASAMRAHAEESLKIALDRRGVLDSGAPDIVHGTHFVLLDDALRIRGYYDSGDAERLERLRRDAEALILAR